MNWLKKWFFNYKKSSQYSDVKSYLATFIEAGVLKDKNKHCK